MSRDAYAAAFHRATGRRLEQPWQFNGRTEAAAATEASRTHGFRAEAGPLDAFLDLIVDELHNRAGDIATAGCVLPGAAGALAGVRTIPGAHQSVLTGKYPVAALAAVQAVTRSNWPSVAGRTVGIHASS